jgi:hypothetical protein
MARRPPFSSRSIGLYAMPPAATAYWLFSESPRRVAAMAMFVDFRAYTEVSSVTVPSSGMNFAAPNPVIWLYEWMRPFAGSLLIRS